MRAYGLHLFQYSVHPYIHVDAVMRPFIRGYMTSLYVCTHAPVIQCVHGSIYLQTNAYKHASIPRCLISWISSFNILQKFVSLHPFMPVFFYPYMLKFMHPLVRVPFNFCIYAPLDPRVHGLIHSHIHISENNCICSSFWTSHLYTPFSSHRCIHAFVVQLIGAYLT